MPRVNRGRTRTPLQSARRNELLDGLTAPNRKKLQRELVLVPLATGQTIYPSRHRPAYVYFPTSGVLSFVVHLRHELSVETGMTGAEGVAGFQALSERGSSGTRCVCQVSGEAHRMSAIAFRRLLGSTPQFSELLKRYMGAFLDQVSQTAACNRHHSVSQRCARWLLMTHDRVQGDSSFALTQEHLSYMLGIRREAVSEAASAFRRRRLITYTRGQVTILNRRGLEGMACECHRVVQKRVKRLYT